MPENWQELYYLCGIRVFSLMKVVLLHGFCEDHSIWNKLISYSKYKDEMITVDLPGFGNNEVYHASAESIDQMAEFVKRQLNKLNIRKCIIIGHSLGGYVTLAFAEKFPEVINAIGLFHSTAMPDSEERKAARLKTIEFVKSNGAKAYHRVLIPNLFKEGTDIKLIERTITAARASKENGIIATLNAMRNRPDRIHVLENLDKPVLLVAGEYDSLIPKHLIIEQAALCPTAMLEVLTNSAHMGQSEEPKKGAEIIDRFIEMVNSQKK